MTKAKLTVQVRVEHCRSGVGHGDLSEDFELRLRDFCRSLAEDPSVFRAELWQGVRRLYTFCQKDREALSVALEEIECPELAKLIEGGGADHLAEELRSLVSLRRPARGER